MSRDEGAGAWYGPDGAAPLIFNRPDLQAHRQRWVFWALTLLAWVVWVYLWLPLITLVGWYLGFRSFFREIVLPDPGTMISSALLYGAIVLAIGVGLITWSRYNLRRFGGEDRRRFADRVTDEEVRIWFGLSPESLAALRSGRALVVEYGEEGMIRRAAPGRSLEAAAVARAIGTGEGVREKGEGEAARAS